MCKCQEMIPLGEIGTLSETGEFSEILEIDEEEVLGYELEGLIGSIDNLDDENWAYLDNMELMFKRVCRY